MRLAARERPSARATGTAYERDRAHVMAVLARRCGWLDHGEREAILHDAYLVLLQKQHDGALELAAMNEHQTRAYLVQTALHKALDEGKRAGRARERSLDADLDAGIEPVDDAAAAPDEQAVTRQTSVQVREIVAELPERQQTIVKLRFFFDRAPEEIQRFLGLSERVYRRELERAMRELSAGVELVRDGAYCDSRRSAILALIAGIAGPNRARDARDHLANCPACAHWAIAVRDSTREAAALLPLPALALAASEHRLARVWEGLRETVAGSTSSAKHHVAETAARLDGATAGYAASLRPGALAAAAAGCLALGGGATYCAVEGVPEPIRALVADEPPDAPEARAPDVPAAGSTAAASAPPPLPPALSQPATPPAVQQAQRRRANRAARGARRRAAQLQNDSRRAERQRAAPGQRSGAAQGSGAPTSPERRRRLPPPRRPRPAPSRQRHASSAPKAPASR